MKPWSTRHWFTQRVHLILRWDKATKSVSDKLVTCLLEHAKCSWRSSALRFRFFYKYNPLPNIIVRNRPPQNLSSKIAWRKEEKVTRGSFRHRAWRSIISATVYGERFIPPLPLAGGDRSHRMKNLYACNSGRQGQCHAFIACFVRICSLAIQSSGLVAHTDHHLPPMGLAERPSRHTLWLNVLSAMRCGGKATCCFFLFPPG
jgi:hypothetical protein